MNESTIIPSNDEEFYNLIVTRPTIMPPKGIELGVLEVSQFHSPEGVVYPKQESYFCAMVWGIAGECHIKIDEVSYTIHSGELLLFNAGGIISAEVNSSSNKGCYLLLDGPQSQKILQETGLWTGIFPYTRSPIIWLEKIATDLNKIEIQPTLASIAHSLLLSAYVDAEQHAPNLMVWRACCYLQKNWNKPRMNVERLLAHMKVSRSTLSPQFKKITGMTILDYLLDIRYRNATRILKARRTSVSQTALQCGFVDASWFSTWYHKRSGVTPRSLIDYSGKHSPILTA